MIVHQQDPLSVILNLILFGLGHDYFSPLGAAAATSGIHNARSTANAHWRASCPGGDQAARILESATAVCAPIARMRNRKGIYLSLSRAKDCSTVPMRDRSVAK
jgi:hypothetical protein